MKKNILLVQIDPTSFYTVAYSLRILFPIMGFIAYYIRYLRKDVYISASVLRSRACFAELTDLRTSRVSLATFKSQSQTNYKIHLIVILD